jgi:hypothetical protein
MGKRYHRLPTSIGAPTSARRRTARGRTSVLPPSSRASHRPKPWLLLAAGAVMAVVAVIAVVVVASRRAQPAAMTGGETTSLAEQAVGCSQMEQLTYHVHAHLALFDQGQPVPVAANVGILPTCISWLHTHAADGILHIEAPAPHVYTLGQFFRVWGQPLDATHLLNRTADGEHEIRAYVGGEAYTGGPPESIRLTPHAVIVLESGPPFVPPPSYTFPAGV